MILKTEDFAGVQPIVAPHMLGQNQAQTALNCKFINGVLQPWRNSTSVDSESVGGAKSIFLYRGVNWITNNVDADIVVGPIVNDTEDRIYRTSADTYPGYSWQGPADSGVFYKLGVPSPDAAPVLAGTYSAEGGDISLIMTSTEHAGGGNISTPCGLEGAGPLVVRDSSHGLETGDQITLSSVSGMTFVNGMLYAVTVLDDDHFSLSGSTPVAGFPYEGGGSWAESRMEADISSRAYCYTFVTGKGEEGPPSDLSIIDVYADETVEVSGMAATPSGNYYFDAAARKRIYRSVSSSIGTKLYLVGEIPITTATFTDDTDPENIGEELPSESWDAPPNDMQGLTAMPNGFLAGFSGRDLCFCVTNMPHAWPVEYRLTVDSDIVAIGAFGQSMVVATKAQPYIVTGTDPASMTLEKLNINQACTSKRGLVNMGYSIIYPSPDGLVEVKQSGVELITRTVFSRDQWQALNPAGIVAFFWEGVYLFFSGAAGYLLNPTMPTLSEFDSGITAGYNDLETDILYFVDSNPATNGIIQIFEGETTAEYAELHSSYRWRSKLFRLPRPDNFACAQVVRGLEGAVVFRLFADKNYDEPIVEEEVENSEPFKLAGGFLNTYFEYELEGNAEVSAVYVAGSMTELASV